MEQPKPPNKLRLIDNVEDWWRWLKRYFTLYPTTIRATQKDNKQKIALLTLAGTEAIDIFNSFQLTVEEQKNYNTILRKCEQFCTPKCRNERYERYVFQQQKSSRVRASGVYHWLKTEEPDMQLWRADRLSLSLEKPIHIWKAREVATAPEIWVQSWNSYDQPD